MVLTYRRHHFSPLKSEFPVLSPLSALSAAVMCFAVLSDFDRPPPCPTVFSPSPFSASWGVRTNYNAVGPGQFHLTVIRVQIQPFSTVLPDLV